ncbi:coagulation factor VIII-like isoform X2 [Pseudophryne corroboree]|uniref:coagulation factor VIII-like isoform X2 n=1 Tax=Pseudophryne corroboree TaxID=495146 RepID=UPI00308166BD
MKALTFLLLSLFLHTCETITRIFYIAAVEEYWNYRDSRVYSSEQRQDLRSSDSQIYKKALYVEYTDATFRKIKPQQNWTGLLGPTIRVETLDSVVIHFKNSASVPYSLHGIGVSYGKRSEGAGYDDETSTLEKADDAIPPGKEYTYVWQVPENYGPTESDPVCITTAYYSHSNSSYDINSGLVGAILICKPGSLTEEGYQRGIQEKIIVLAIFDEGHSHYSNKLEDKQLHTINGHINGSIPEQTVCYQKPVHLHVIGFGTHFEVHSISLERHNFVIRDHRVPILSVTAFSFLTAIVHPGEKGEYTLSCQTRTHPEGTMTSLIKVEDCASLPVKQMRASDLYDYEDEDYYDSTIWDLEDNDNDISNIQVRSAGKRKPVTWTHYVGAIETEWDYQPESEKNTRFTKVVYREFTDSQFTHLKPPEIPGTGILGPVLRGEVGDQIQIVFKNLARHPFNMYPQGLSSVSSNRPSLTGEQLMDYPIYPNDSITYIWPVTKYDSPASSDPRCLTRYYASFYHPQKDLASGLIGPLLICSKQTLDQRGNQIVTDKEHFLFFSEFDETLSWYYEQNFQSDHKSSSENRIISVKSERQSLMHTINGLVDSLHLSFHQNEVSVWHVLNLGISAELLSIYFGGNTFMVDSSYQETLTLFPMNGKTVVMNMEKPGHWYVAPKSPLAELGMRAKLNVMQDDYYDYDHDDAEEFAHDPSFFKNSLTTPPKIFPFGPRSILHKKKIPENRENTIVNDDPLTNWSQSVGAIDNTTEAKHITEYETEELHNDIHAEHRDENVPINLSYKQLQNESAINKTAHNHVDYYDDYNNVDFEYIDLYEDQSDKDPRSTERELRTYFIAAVEVRWEYGAGNSPYLKKQKHSVSHGFQWYKKVVFREYLDSSFTVPAIRGERDAHLGLLGPCIHAEVNDEIIIQFKNMASRPYSFYSNVLTVQKKEEYVPPHQTRTYTGRLSAQFGPTESEEECKTWFYTSNVHLNKDFHTGLIGPLLVCRPKVLKRSNVLQFKMQDFFLAFMEIDETENWLFKENWEQHCPSYCPFQQKSNASCPAACTVQSPSEDLQQNHVFHVINGNIGDTLPGLLLPLKQKIRWHLLSIGRRHILSVQFHGNIVTQRSNTDQPVNIVNLYPGVGVTLDMVAHITGLWHIEAEGGYYNYGMKALYLVYDQKCHQPLGLSSGKISDSQISASGHYGSWLPSLARLKNSGSVNAWSVVDIHSWIQVDLLTPMLIHAIQTQGARSHLLSLYISQFIVFYSLNGEKWSQYQGNASSNQMVFFGNVDSSSVRENHFDPPICARFLRLQPIHTGVRAGLRMELFGCDLTSCSMSLGLQSGAIHPQHLSASSSLYSVFSSWVPNLARLNQQGRINAWRPRIFQANKDSDTPLWVTIETPIITRFLKLHPEKWNGGIALRMEVLGCNI